MYAWCEANYLRRANFHSKNRRGATRHGIIHFNLEQHDKNHFGSMGNIKPVFLAIPYDAYHVKITKVVICVPLLYAMIFMRSFMPTLIMHTAYKSLLLMAMVSFASMLSFFVLSEH